MKRVELGPAAKPLPHQSRSGSATVPTGRSRVLELQRAIGNRATGRVLARIPNNVAKGGWTLLYKDKFGSYEDDDGNLRWRKIELNDHEFYADYVDYNIDHATADVDQDAGRWQEMEVYYRDGRRKKFKRGDLPTTDNYAPGRKARGVRALHLDSFEKHDEDEFIYPTYKGMVVLTPYVAPNLTSLREQADAKAKELAALRQLAWLTIEFINNMAKYSAVAGLGDMQSSPRQTPRRGGGRRNTSVRLHNTTEQEPSTQGGVPREEPTSAPTGRGGQPERSTPMTLPESGPQQHQQPGQQQQARHQANEQARLRQQQQRAEQRQQQEQQQSAQEHQQPHQQQQATAGAMRTDEIAKRGYPLGFKSRGQFKQFGEAAKGTLRRAGYDDVEVGMQGSAVTGRRATDGSPFDSGRVSDFDVAVVSPKLFAEARSQGIAVRASGAAPHAEDHTTFALTPDQAAALGVGDLALTKTWSQGNGRAVNVMVFASRAAATAKETNTIWAR